MPRTRYLVIWSPLFEKGRSRHEAISLIKFAWQMKAPQLVTRRNLELKTTKDPYILQHCSEWMEKHWGRHLKPDIKALSIIAITDPVWQETDGEETFKMTVTTMESGHNYQATKAKEKPQQCFLGIERESL